LISDHQIFYLINSWTPNCQHHSAADLLVGTSDNVLFGYC